jgi:hypothetical protein
MQTERLDQEQVCDEMLRNRDMTALKKDEFNSDSIVHLQMGSYESQLLGAAAEEFKPGFLFTHVLKRPSDLLL